MKMIRITKDTEGLDKVGEFTMLYTFAEVLNDPLMPASYKEGLLDFVKASSCEWSGFVKDSDWTEEVHTYIQVYPNEFAFVVDSIDTIVDGIMKELELC